ncbi:MAG: ABC transporter substrate-binding protein [Desulfobacterales bacterium]|nr:ABC transporter substrate-binding protein [Desulfobacterales bacterium]
MEKKPGISAPVTRRHFLKTSAAAACSGLILPRRAFSSQPPLRLGYLPITDATPLLVAHGLGFFEEEGLKVEKPVMVRSWKVLTEAFLTNKFDLTHMLFPIPIWMRFKQKQPVKVLAWDHINGSAVTVRSNSGIESFADLGGKQVAVPSWYSMHNMILQMGLRTMGLTPVIKPQSAKLAPHEVNLFILPPPDMPPALLGKKADAFIVADPFNALAELKFKARIMRHSGDIWKNHPCCVIVAHESFIRLQPTVVQKGMNAIVRAQAWCREHPNETARLLSREGKGYLPVPRKVLEKVFAPANPKELKHPQWRIPRIDFQPYPYPSATRFIMDQMQRTRMQGDKEFLRKLDTGKAVRRLVDTRFVKKALEETVGMSAFCDCTPSQQFKREEIIEIN